MRIATAIALIALFTFACSDSNEGASSDTNGDGGQEREIVILGEPAMSESDFREQQQARIEQYGFEAVCVTGLDSFRSSVEDAPGDPTADNLRALEIVEDLCADAGE